jgi:hypothetical protein
LRHFLSQMPRRFSTARPPCPVFQFTTALVRPMQSTAARRASPVRKQKTEPQRFDTLPLQAPVRECDWLRASKLLQTELRARPGSGSRHSAQSRKGLNHLRERETAHILQSLGASCQYKAKGECEYYLQQQRSLRGFSWPWLQYWKCKKSQTRREEMGSPKHRSQTTKRGDYERTATLSND